MDAGERARKRRGEAARLRQAANSATPRAYHDPRNETLTREDLDPENAAKESENTVAGAVVDLYGAFTRDQSWQTSPIWTAVSLSSYAFAWVLMAVVLSVAQCSFWYEPGMYSDIDPSVVAHGR